MMKNEMNQPCYLVEMPSLKVLRKFQGYTTDAARQMAAHNCRPHNLGTYYGIYTAAQLAVMQQKREA